MSKTIEMIADKFVKAIEAGTAPWQKPWSSGGTPGYNPVTGTRYKGYNFWATLLAGYDCPYWMTYKQVTALDGNVKKGQHGEHIFYVAFKDRAEGGKDFAGIRYYTIFNLEQTEGLNSMYSWEKPDRQELSEDMKLRAGDLAWYDYKHAPKMVEGGKASYSPTDDVIMMPAFKSFNTPEEYYATLFHEAAHSTGHSKRLARPGIVNHNGFGSYDYGVEELVAELASARMMYELKLDVPVFDNSASYLSGWIRTIKAKPSIVYKACQESEKAFLHIRGESINEKELAA